MEAAAEPQREIGPERERSRSPSRADGKLTGTAKRWNDEKGFGFINPDDGGEDVFCHRTSIEDGDCLVEGARLSYTKGWDERKNKERAEHVTGGSQRGAAAGYGAAAAGYGGAPGYPPGYPPGYGYAAPPAAGKSTGTVKRWNEESGFGFIKPDDGSEDLFVHRTSIEGAEALPDGGRVTYNKEWDGAKQKWKAEKCQIVAGAGAGAYGGPMGGYAPYGGSGMFGSPYAGAGAPPPMYGSLYAPQPGAPPGYSAAAPAYGAAAPAYGAAAAPAYGAAAPAAYGAPGAPPQYAPPPGYSYAPPPGYSYQ